MYYCTLNWTDNVCYQWKTRFGQLHKWALTCILIAVSGVLPVRVMLLAHLQPYSFLCTDWMHLKGFSPISDLTGDLSNWWKLQWAWRKPPETKDTERPFVWPHDFHLKVHVCLRETLPTPSRLLCTLLTSWWSRD